MSRLLTIRLVRRHLRDPHSAHDRDVFQQPLSGGTQRWTFGVDNRALAKV